VALGVAVPLGVGVTVAEAVAVGVGVTVGVGGGVEVGVAVAVAVGVGVGVIGGVGVGVGVKSVAKGASTLTLTGEPVLKKLIFAVLLPGSKLESNRKLYNVPKRIALAFWLVAKVSVLQMIELLPTPILTSHGVLL
jgi:hypothetical protein